MKKAILKDINTKEDLSPITLIESVVDNNEKNLVDILSEKVSSDKVVSKDEYEMFNKIKIITQTDFDELGVGGMEQNVRYIVIGKSIELGEVWVYNYKTGEKSYMTIDTIEKLSNPKDYEPIGIVAIPSSHNVYGDGTPGIMSLKYARCDTPDTGGAAQDITLGNNYDDIYSDIVRFDPLKTIPYLEYSINISNVIQEQQYTENGYIPLDSSTDIKNPYDTKRCWSKTSKSGTHIPSPFLEDGSKNMQFMKGIFEDVQGKLNTQRYLEAKLTNDELPIISKALNGYLLVEDKEWYIPTITELVYMASNNKMLNEILTSNGLEEIKNGTYDSSTYLNASCRRIVSIPDGSVYYDYGNINIYMKLFKNVKKTGTIGQFHKDGNLLDSYEEGCDGIVVVPSSHNIYGDGSCGVMSLKYLTENGLDKGKVIKFCEYDATKFKGYPINTSGLIGGPRVYGVDSMSNIDFNVIAGHGSANIPSDSYTGQLTNDKLSRYKINSGQYAPSVYTSTGEKNPQYDLYQQGVFTNNDVYDIIFSHIPSEDWKTSDTIENPKIQVGGLSEIPAGHWPAFQSCWRFHTVGTNQGDWVIPSIGELIYMFNRMTYLNGIMTRLNKIYDKCAYSITEVTHRSCTFSEDYLYYAFIISSYNALNSSTYPISRASYIRPFIKNKGGH